MVSDVLSAVDIIPLMQSQSWPDSLYLCVVSVSKYHLSAVQSSYDVGPVLSTYRFLPHAQRELCLIPWCASSLIHQATLLTGFVCGVTSGGALSSIAGR